MGLAFDPNQTVPITKSRVSGCRGSDPCGSDPCGSDPCGSDPWFPVVLLHFIRAHDLLNSSFSAILYVDFITSLEVNIFLHCNYLMTYVINYSADKSLCQS